MAPRNPDTDYTDGGKKYGMRHVPPTCDGFSVTFMCDVNCRDCRHGSCWHMDRVRMMVRGWFAGVGYVDRTQTIVRREPPAPPKLTKAQSKEAKEQHERDRRWENRRAEIRSREFWARFKERWWGVPDRLWHYRDTGGFPHGALDPDAIGSWGMIVRQWEDRADER